MISVLVLTVCCLQRRNRERLLDREGTSSVQSAINTIMMISDIKKQKEYNHNAYATLLCARANLTIIVLPDVVILSSLSLGM